MEGGYCGRHSGAPNHRSRTECKGRDTSRSAFARRRDARFSPVSVTCVLWYVAPQTEQSFLPDHIYFGDSRGHKSGHNDAGQIWIPTISLRGTSRVQYQRRSGETHLQDLCRKAQGSAVRKPRGRVLKKETHFVSSTILEQILVSLLPLLPGMRKIDNKYRRRACEFGRCVGAACKPSGCQGGRHRTLEVLSSAWNATTAKHGASSVRSM